MLVLSVAFALALAAPPDTAAVEREAKEIERLLIAPCCWTQPVSDHYSAEADEIRSEVRRMLAAGQTRAAILDAYVAKYGQRILVEPRPEGFAAFLHYLPWVFLAAGGAVTAIVIRRFAGRATASPPPSGTPVYADRPAPEAGDPAREPVAATSMEDEDRLEEELGKLD